MKLVLSALVATLAGAALAGPLVKENVDQNAKWLLHMDLDQFRASQLGQFVIKEFVVKKVDEAKASANNFLTNVDVLKIIGQLHSLTAYGTGFETGSKFNGVVLLQVEPETRKILEGLAAGLLLKDDGSFTKTNDEGAVFYSLRDEFFASPQNNGLILFSKSKASIKQAAAVIAGKSRNLVRSKAFADFAPVNDTFILLAVAEGFQDSLPIPPEANVLKKADGARVVLGERTGNVFVNLALKAKDAEVLKQIQQVVEGMVALAALSQSENKELQQLVQSIKVVLSEKVVSVAAVYPVDSLVTRASQMLADAPKRHHKSDASPAEKPEPSAGDAQQ